MLRRYLKFDLYKDSFYPRFDFALAFFAIPVIYAVENITKKLFSNEKPRQNAKV